MFTKETVLDGSKPEIVLSEKVAENGTDMKKTKTKRHMPEKKNKETAQDIGDADIGDVENLFHNFVEKSRKITNKKKNYIK